MDAIDAKILNIIQNGLPLHERPYSVIAEQVGITEEECISRVQSMRASGVIRRIGAVFDTARMGMKSTLCAMAVPGDRVEEVAALLSQYDEVTHNYGRKHDWNLWFTVTARSVSERERILAEIEEKCGYKVISMPVIKGYKIKAVFNLDEQ